MHYIWMKIEKAPFRDFGSTTDAVQKSLCRKSNGCANSRKDCAYFATDRSDSKSDRADSQSDRADSQSDRADSKSDRVEFNERIIGRSPCKLDSRLQPTIRAAQPYL